MATEIQSGAMDKPTAMDSEKQVLRSDKVDAALEFLNAEDTTVTEVDEKVLVRKIDWRIVPLMCEYTPGLSAAGHVHLANTKSQGLATICSISTRP